MVVKTPQFSILLPTLNEGHSLPSLLAAIQRLPLAKRAEILIIDGGSTDHTRDAFMQASSKWSNLHWVEAPPGKALALRIGFSRARAPFIAFMDADGQYAPQSLASVCRALQSGADLVVTHRRVKFTDHLRRSLSLGYAHVIGRGLLQLRVHDPQSGLKAVRADLLSRLHFTARHWDLDSQLISQAQHAHARIKEIEIEFHPRYGGRTKTDVVGTSTNLLVSGLHQALSAPPALGPKTNTTHAFAPSHGVRHSPPISPQTNRPSSIRKKVKARRRKR
jgi:glycosyltransferase involved in cell wall biosynthesis